MTNFLNLFSEKNYILVNMVFFFFLFKIFLSIQIGNISCQPFFGNWWCLFLQPSFFSMLDRNIKTEPKYNLKCSCNVFQIKKIFFLSCSTDKYFSSVLIIFVFFFNNFLKIFVSNFFFHNTEHWLAT